jgi:hypothetical protein
MNLLALVPVIVAIGCGCMVFVGDYLGKKRNQKIYAAQLTTVELAKSCLDDITLEYEVQKAVLRRLRHSSQDAEAIHEALNYLFELSALMQQAKFRLSAELHILARYE